MLNYRYFFGFGFALASSLSMIIKSTILVTNFETIKTAGKATRKPKLHALSQLCKRLSVKPRLKKVITNDMMPDISKAMTNE